MPFMKMHKAIILLIVVTLLAAACGGETDDADVSADDVVDDVASAVGQATENLAVPDTTQEPVDPATTAEPAAPEMTEGGTEGAEVGTAAPQARQTRDPATICHPSGILKTIEKADPAGTMEGMATEPVATAASNNPVLTTLTQAISAAGLTDTLNAAEALTVFAPTDCAFALMDPATMDAAMADPTGLLTTVLSYHVIPDQRLSAEELDGNYTSLSGEEIFSNGTNVARQGRVIVPDIQTANATVHLIQTVLTPPGVSGG